MEAFSIVGVPEIVPVTELSVKPVGSAGETEKPDIDPPEFEKVTGVIALLIPTESVVTLGEILGCVHVEEITPGVAVPPYK